MMMMIIIIYFLIFKLKSFYMSFHCLCPCPPLSRAQRSGAGDASGHSPGLLRLALEGVLLPQPNPNPNPNLNY